MSIRRRRTDDWQSLLEPIVDRYRDDDIKKFFRADAAFANPEVYAFLEAEEFLYAIRLPGNGVLYEAVKHLLVRPVGRPPKKPVVSYHSFSYQAGSWDKPRRVVAKVEWHQGELFPRMSFILTNLAWCPFPLNGAFLFRIVTVMRIRICNCWTRACRGI